MSNALKKHRLYAWDRSPFWFLKKSSRGHNEKSDRKCWAFLFSTMKFQTKKRDYISESRLVKFNYLKLNSQFYNSYMAEIYPDEVPEYLTEIETFFPLEISFNASRCNSEISLPVPSNDPLSP